MASPSKSLIEHEEVHLRRIGTHWRQNDPMSELDAVRLACDGDANAFGRLYQLHSRRIYSLCLRIIGNRSDAEDLTHETFLHLFRKIHTFRGESRFSTWLHRLATNIVFMRLRKKRYPEISLDATMEASDDNLRPLLELGGPDLRLSGMLDHVNLSAAIGRLPKGYREIFILHDVEGYEHKEIAGILACSVGNSKSQLFKARVRLREFLHEGFRSRAREQRENQPATSACSTPAARQIPVSQILKKCSATR